MDTPRHWHIGLVGYGEVGRILAEDLRAQGLGVSTCDLKFAGEAGAALREHAAAHGVGVEVGHAALAGRADLVVSAVTASQTVAVAEACAPSRAARRLLPRLQFRLSGGQATRRRR